MIDMLRICSVGLLENVTIEESTACFDNHIILGTESDILRLNLVRLNEALRGGGAKVKFSAYDANYLAVENEASREVGELATSIMKIAFMRPTSLSQSKFTTTSL